MLGVSIITVDGLAYLASKRFIEARPVAFQDLGMEGIHEFVVKDMPVTVSADSTGDTVHQKLPKNSVEYLQQRPSELPPRQGIRCPTIATPGTPCASLHSLLRERIRMLDKPTNSRLGHRVRVFVDFWNFTLSMKEIESGFRSDWSVLGQKLTDAAGKIINPSALCEYQGLNFYGSYDVSSEQDRKLLRWATEVVAQFPGVRVSMVQRQKKQRPPVCPKCYKPVPTCPSCKSDMRGTGEKGVDVRMATDMISLAWVDNYDIAVLVSSDRDFVPVAEFLETKGIKVIHGVLPPKGKEVSKSCWGSIDVASIRESFRQRKGLN